MTQSARTRPVRREPPKSVEVGDPGVVTIGGVDGEEDPPGRAERPATGHLDSPGDFDPNDLGADRSRTSSDRDDDAEPEPDCPGATHRSASHPSDGP